MTPDEIKAMGDEELDRQIWMFNNGVARKRSYSTDLNAAWPLQFGSDWLMLDGWSNVLDSMFDELCYPSDPRRCARLISEAYLYLKTKGEGEAWQVKPNVS